MERILPSLEPTNEEIYYVLKYIQKKCENCSDCAKCMFKIPDPRAVGCGLTFTAPSFWTLRKPNEWNVFDERGE